MKELICNVNPFVLKQQIYLFNPITKEQKLFTTCNFSDLVMELEDIVVNLNVYTLHLMGEQRFIEMVGKDLDSALALKYGAADIYIQYNQ